MKLNAILTEQLLYEMPYTPLEQDGTEKTLSQDTSKFTHFLSVDTLKDEWKLIKHTPTYTVYINNDHNMAVIGQMGKRADDGKPGMHIVVTADFKDTQDLGPDVAQLKGALQIDLVVANNQKLARQGFGTKLYFALAEAGMTIISDNTQYKGGKQLWVNMAQRAGQNFVINILDNGKVRVGADGKPVEFDGTNESPESLWSGRAPERTQPSGLTAAGKEEWERRQDANRKIPDRFHVLFVLRKR